VGSIPRAFGTALRAENYSLCESRTPISQAVLGDAALVVLMEWLLHRGGAAKKGGAKVTRAEQHIWPTYPGAGVPMHRGWLGKQHDREWQDMTLPPH